MECTIDGVKIRAIATEIPERIISIDSYAEVFGEKKVKRLKKSTGVEEVRVVSQGETASDLCVRAAEKLFSQEHIVKESIDGVVFASISPDYRAPGTAGLLQDRLGLSNEVVALDLTFGCSAYIYGLYEACLLLKAGGCKRVLLCTGDTQSTLVNEKDRAMKMLVGDAGSATLLELGDGCMEFYIKTFGIGYQGLIIEGGGCRMPSSEETRKEIEDEDGNIRSKDDLYMDGSAIMEFSLSEVPVAVDAICRRMHREKKDIGLFALHQPNKLILDYLRMRMELTEDVCPTGLKKTGNTASASIPLLLTTLKERGYDFSHAKQSIACGFGIGLSIGAAGLDVSQINFYA